MLGRYFSGAGIDVSDHHVRIAQVGLFGTVGRLEEIDLPEGLVADERVVKPEELKAIVMEKLNRLGFTNEKIRTTVLIPESRVFSRSVLLDYQLRGEELNARARDEAQRDIPVPFSQARVSVSEGAREADKLRTTVYAVEKAIFDPLVSMFLLPSLRLVAVESNSKAILRLLERAGSVKLHKDGAKALVGIVDIGHSWTTISVYTQRGSSVFSRTIPHRITEALDLKNPLLPDRIVDIIIETIQEVVVFFEGNNMKIDHVVLAGVEAHDDRLKEKIAVQQASLPISLIGEAVTLKGVSKKQVHTFGAAIGAALRSVVPSRYTYQHNFLTRT